jgi:hypothetical protein
LPFVLDRHRRYLEIGAGGGRGMFPAAATGAGSRSRRRDQPGIVAASLHAVPATA